MTQRFRLDLAYDGTDFAGWQRQPGRSTVQGLVERVLSRIDGDRPVTVHGAGRTDAGVHARQQVAHFVLETPIEPRDLCHALGCMLPDEVRPIEVLRVDESFDARRSRSRKTYAYQVDRSRRGDPLLARYAWHVRLPFDEPRLEAALARLIGRRDWSGFAAASCTIVDRVRDLDRAEWQRGSPDRLLFRADGFLTHMVRNLAGTLVEIATGRLGEEAIERALSSGDRRRAGPTAPARGLILERVEYDR